MNAEFKIATLDAELTGTKRLMDDKDHRINQLERFADIGTRALFLLDRMVWEMGDGAEFTGGKISDGLFDAAEEILKRAKVVA